MIVSKFEQILRWSAFSVWIEEYPAILFTFANSGVKSYMQ